MPLPKPKPTELRSQYISRCMEYMTVNEKDKFPSREQRAAICYSEWNRHRFKKKKKK